MLSGRRVIVLPRARGGPDMNWFPWLQTALEAEGIEVLRPRLPTPQGQSLEACLAAHDLAVEPRPPAPTTLVGHSLGAALALRLVERAAEPVDGLFLVGGFGGALGLPDYDPINRTFFAAPFDWAGIRARKGRGGRCWAGDDDPYVRIGVVAQPRSEANSPSGGNPRASPMIIWLNGGFCAGKTTLAKELRRRVPGAVVFDPEELGLLLWKWLPLNDDFPGPTELA